MSPPAMAISCNISVDPARWKQTMSRFIIMEAQTDLLEIVCTRHAPSRFASRLNRRQQKRYQDGNDRNHD